MNIILKDGTILKVFSDNDILDCIRENLGYEMEEIIKKHMDNTYAEINKNESDFKNYEGTLDSHNCLFNDIIDYVEKIKKEIEKKRTNKYIILDTLKRIEKEVTEQI